VLRSLHGGWSWVVIVANGLAGLWALAAARWHRFRRRALWWFTGFAQGATFVAVILGVWLMAGQHVEAPQFHTFYGFLTIISVAIIHSYRQQLQHRLYLLYGLGGLFIMGLGIRAVVLK
jgi:hypothetical protein